MSWRVLVRAENPDPGTLSTLEELTGLGRGEVLLALRRNGLSIGDGFDEARARSLSANLGGMGLSCSLSKIESSDPETSQFRVVLTGFKPGYRARLRETLQRLSGLPPEQIVVWLSRIPFVLKDSIDHETARKIKRLLTESGGMVDLRPVSTIQARAAEPPAGPGAESVPVEPVPPAPVDLPETPAGQEQPGSGGQPRSGKKPETVQKRSEPPSHGLEQPPVLPEGRRNGEQPPRLLFQWPGRTPVDPPVALTAEQRERIPPSTVDSPPVVATTPSPPGNGLSIYLHSVSQDAVEGVLGTLCGDLDFKREEAEALIRKGLPSRVALVHSFEKAAEIASVLERPGVTVSLSSSTPMRRSALQRSEGFISWLNRNG